MPNNNNKNSTPGRHEPPGTPSLLLSPFSTAAGTTDQDNVGYNGYVLRNRIVPSAAHFVPDDYIDKEDEDDEEDDESWYPEEDATDDEEDDEDDSNLWWSLDDDKEQKACVQKRSLGARLGFVLLLLLLVVGGIALVVSRNESDPFEYYLKLWNKWLEDGNDATTSTTSANKQPRLFSLRNVQPLERRPPLATMDDTTVTTTTTGKRPRFIPFRAVQPLVGRPPSPATTEKNSYSSIMMDHVNHFGAMVWPTMTRLDDDQPWVLSDVMESNQDGWIYARGLAKTYRHGLVWVRVPDSKSASSSSSKNHQVILHALDKAATTKAAPSLWWRGNKITNRRRRQRRVQVVIDATGYRWERVLLDVYQLGHVLVRYVQQQGNIVVDAVYLCHMNHAATALLLMAQPWLWWIMADDITPVIHVLAQGDDSLLQQQLSQVVPRRLIPAWLGGKDSYQFRARRYYKAQLQQTDLVEELASVGSYIN